MKYFKFNDVSDKESSTGAFFERWSAWFLSKIIPKANPDFEKKFSSVECWLIEFDEENGVTNREIGLGQNGEVLTKAPFLKNLGIWCDSDMKLSDYSQLRATPIASEEFECFWDKLII